MVCLSLLSPVLGETDAPAPVRAKEWARERGRVRVFLQGN
jgi:hypothetical protein